MREHWFRYVFRHVATGRIEKLIYSLSQLEEKNVNDLSPLFNVGFGYELIGRDEFVGLKDKNGKEIYEGDIISTDLDRPFNIVVFRNGAFMFQCHDSGKDYYDYMFSVEEESDRWEYGEVIGNIYENPELLEETV